MIFLTPQACHPGTRQPAQVAAGTARFLQGDEGLEDRGMADPGGLCQVSDGTMAWAGQHDRVMTVCLSVGSHSQSSSG